MTRISSQPHALSISTQPGPGPGSRLSQLPNNFPAPSPLYSPTGSAHQDPNHLPSPSVLSPRFGFSLQALQTSVSPHLIFTCLSMFNSFSILHCFSTLNFNLFLNIFKNCSACSQNLQALKISVSQYSILICFSQTSIFQPAVQACIAFSAAPTAAHTFLVPSIQVTLIRPFLSRLAGNLVPPKQVKLLFRLHR